MAPAEAWNRLPLPGLEVRDQPEMSSSAAE